MLKFVVVLHRKQGLTPEQFRTEFIRTHEPPARKIPRLRQYKQNFVLHDPKRKRPLWDCVVELYFDDWDMDGVSGGKNGGEVYSFTSPPSWDFY